MTKSSFHCDLLENFFDDIKKNHETALQKYNLGQDDYYRQCLKKMTKLNR